MASGCGRDEDVVEEVIEREIESWPLLTRFAIHPRMQSVTLEVILRAVFGVSDERRLAQLRSLSQESSFSPHRRRFSFAFSFTAALAGARTRSRR